MGDSACWSEFFPWAAWKEGSAKTFVKVKQRIKIARQKKKKKKTNQKYPDQEKNASPRQYERVTQEMFLQIRQLSKKKKPEQNNNRPFHPATCVLIMGGLCLLWCQPQQPRWRKGAVLLLQLTETTAAAEIGLEKRVKTHKTTKAITWSVRHTRIEQSWRKAMEEHLAEVEAQPPGARWLAGAVRAR